MDWLKNEPSLRRLQQERRNRDVEEKLKEEKPLEEVLGKVMRSSPTLKTLFLAGQRLSRPFAGKKTGGSGDGSGTGGGSKRHKKRGEFIGKRHPTYFDVAGVRSGEVLRRKCELGRRCRIKFRTDVENSYFDRATDNGTYDIEIVDEEGFSVPNANFSLDDGDAFLSISLPPEAKAGDRFTVESRVDDPTLVEPFVSLVRLTVNENRKRKGGEGQKKRKHGAGTGKQGQGEGIALPEVVPVKQGDDNWNLHKFDSGTACHVVSDLSHANGKEVVEYTFYINLSNVFLLTEMKYRPVDPRVLEAKFKYGNVLLGLAMLHADQNNNGNGNENNAEEKVPIADEIRTVTCAVSPVLLPMIDQLSGLSEDELDSFGIVDDD